MKVSILRLAHATDLPLPAYATAGAAGMDLHAANETSVEIQPSDRAVVPTGLSIELPEGFEAQVRPRSGLAANHGVTVLNTPGTIDSDYRGEIKAILVNLGDKVFRVTRGMKIAQLVVTRHEHAELEEALELPASKRNEGGFGSTGLSVNKA